jgi:hypothetical protein
MLTRDRLILIIRTIMHVKLSRFSGKIRNSFDEIPSSHRFPQGSGLRQNMSDYSRDLQRAEWGSGIVLRSSNPSGRCVAMGH